MPAVDTSQPARLVDIARECGVSRATVSKVLLGTGGPNTRVSDETARRVRAAAKRRNFRPNLAARQLKGVRTHLIGLITGFGSSPTLFDRLAQFETGAWQRGYRLLPCHAHADVDRAMTYVDDLVARGAEGLILVDLLPAMVERMAERRGQLPPHVFQSREPMAGEACVVLDRAEGVRRAVHHLHDTGRRRIALAVGAGAEPATRLRRLGYQRGMAECDLKQDPALDWPWIHPHPEQTDFERVVRDLVIRGGADAVIASDDHVGVQLIKHLKRRGIHVPDDVAVVGFNNLDITMAADPELTSVDQCNAQVVDESITLLTEMIEKGNTPARRRLVTVSPKLVIRGSTVSAV